MDIQRGDQVYYRGEVWEVIELPRGKQSHSTLKLRQLGGHGWHRERYAYLEAVQRVEQVR